jgi:tetratricopeptide (TPR) repeat protein
MESANEALKAADRLNHPNTTCVALYWKSILYTLMNKPQKVIELCGRLINLCETLDIPLWLSVGNILLGWANCKTNKLAIGFEQMQKGFDAYHAMNIGLFRPLMKIVEAQVLIQRGESQQAILNLQEMFEIEDEGGEWWLNSLGLSSLGDALMTANSKELRKAESYWQRALLLAEQQNAASQLRIAEDSLGANSNPIKS